MVTRVAESTARTARKNRPSIFTTALWVKSTKPVLYPYVGERGLSVPDADMLITISEALETPVSTLLGETVIEPKADDLKVISEKLEIINLQLAQRKIARRKAIHWLLISLCAVIVIISAVLMAFNSPYLGWDYSSHETAVVGVAFHAFEWLFVRLAPIILTGAFVGIFLTRKKV